MHGAYEAEGVTLRGRRSQLGHGAKIARPGALVALAALLLAVVLVAIIASVVDTENWTAASWASLTISLLLGIYFFGLTHYINRKAQARAVMVADAALITSTGLLAMNSARSLTTHNRAAALRVAADARAALQHYPLSAPEIKEELVEAVIDAYIDLTFSSFASSDGLARSVWNRLSSGAADVVHDARRLMCEAGEGRQRESLGSVVDHVAFAGQMGAIVREWQGAATTVRGSQTLEAVWDQSESPASSSRLSTDAPERKTVSRLSRFEMLYRRELTVLHDWQLLRDNADKLECAVEIVEIEATEGWRAPWYVGSGFSSDAQPVGVWGGPLLELAKHDRLYATEDTPRWPYALTHGQLPTGMRSSSIEGHCSRLRSQPSSTICVLVYEMSGDEGTREVKRLVLDGNHRLAAARRLAESQADGLGITSLARNFRVLTFVIRELEPIVGLATSDRDANLTSWLGFTPDVGLMREF